MKKLLDIAARAADQAEVFKARSDEAALQMRNGIPTHLSASIQTGFALRLLKNGMVGTAYTKNLRDREGLVRDALASLKGEVRAEFSLPTPADIPAGPATDGSVESMGFHDLSRYGEETREMLRGKVEGQIDVYAGRTVAEIEVVNTHGLDLVHCSALMYVYASLLFPATETSVHRFKLGRSARGFEADELDSLTELYRAGLPEVEIQSGTMKVLFTPDTLFTLLWRLNAGVSGKSFYDKVSPLIGREGHPVISDAISYGGDPTDPADVQGRLFDDEGVPTARRMVFDKGVFTGPVLNLDYAARLGLHPTGNGYRKGDEPVASLPSPSIQCAVIEAGDLGFEDMVASMDRGVIVLGVLGAHSGNILNGDFSVGLNPGYYVEDGRILGRIKDGMIAGNAYDALSRVVSVEDRLTRSTMGGRYPSILLDGVSVAGKNSP